MISSKPKNCLVISSRPPLHSGGLGLDVISSLKQEGIDVDYLTRYREDTFDSSIIGIRPKPKENNMGISKIIGITKNSFLYRVAKEIYRFFKPSKSPYIINNGIEIKYINENKPTFEINEVLENVKKRYDLIITIFWQDMINSSTLKSLYDNQQCPILVYSPDMSPMTGGCFYFGNCTRYKVGCGICPGLNSGNLNDQTRENYQIKKHNYESMNIAFLGNTWMLNRFRASAFRNNCQAYNVGIVIDEKRFIPYHKELRTEKRTSFGFLENDFLILIRSTSDIRKGNDEIYESILQFQNQYKGNRAIRVLTVGSSYFTEKAKGSGITVLDYSQVDTSTLIDLYNISDVFVSASIDDAGPSMINQSLMCGTPVVSYNAGVAIDVIKNGESGYIVSRENRRQMPASLDTIINMDSDSYYNMRLRSRQIALQNNSKKAFSNKIIAIYNQLSKTKTVLSDNLKTNECP